MIGFKEKNWIDKAIEKDKSILEVKKKLQAGNYPEEEINKMLQYYRQRVDELGKGMIKAEEIGKEEEGEFKESVKQYFENDKELGFFEKRRVKKFLANVKKLSEVLKLTIEGITKELDYIKSQGWMKEKVEKELEVLKEEMVDTMLKCTDILTLIDPITKEIATKENLMKNNIEDLIKMLKQSVIDTEEALNGKVA